MNNELKTLRYWFDVEALTAPDAEDADDKSNEHYVTYLRCDRTPWAVLDQSTKVRYTHFVRFGIINKSAYENELLNVLKTKNKKDYDTSVKKKTSGFTYLGVVKVDPNGLPQPSTLELAAFASSFASLKNQCFIDYDNLSMKMNEIYNTLCARYLKGKKKADKYFFSYLLEKLLAFLEWTPSQNGVECPDLIVVSKLSVNKHGKPKRTQIEPVNGFFLDDLRSVINDYKSGKTPGLVSEYLEIHRERTRTDCTKNGFIDDILSHQARDNWPDGKWPSQYSLALMQQVAVNSAFARTQNGGIFSINGPPGTGKTTLLMDVVAAVITERAKVLSTFNNPKEAFHSHKEINYPNTTYPAKVYRLDKRLHDFQIVVASSNNGAVENVTREFPSSDKIDEKFIQLIDFFPEVATKLINTSADDVSTNKAKLSAWGLISAVLGRSSNRSVFKNIIHNKDAPDVIEFLKKQQQNPQSWESAKAEFKLALQHVRDAKDMHRRYENYERKIVEYHDAINRYRNSVEKYVGMILEVAAKVDTANASIKSTEEMLKDIDRNIDISKPGLLSHIFSLIPIPSGIFATSRERLRSYDALVRDRIKCSESLKVKRQTLTNIEKELRNAQSKKEESEKLIKDTSKDLLLAEEKKNAIVNNIANFQSFSDFVKLNQTGNDLDEEHKRQTSLPRSCDVLDHARAMLFVKSLALHKSFIINAGRPFSGNLQRAIGMITGDSTVKTIAPAYGGELWATLSLVVPVVSSTFSSFSRCFEYMPRGGIGWLIVDEAGQAVPQHAIGALARSKRALIVGDPLQVQPVITLDKNIDEALIARHQAPLEHQSTMKSLQLLADANNPFGTYLSNINGDDVWVGSPLRVHRRCLEPMFSISNAIAYNNTMVHAQKGSPEDDTRLGRSKWIDVPGNEGANQHYFPNQGQLALDIVRAFFDQEWFDKSTDLPSLFIISPFKSVAREVKILLSDNIRLLTANHSSKEVQKWINKSVGTVHTFQGKEAETVVFILGGSSDGAIRWATNEPNIINVGVTRSKKQLYIIGDWSQWMKTPLIKKTMSLKWRESHQKAKERIREFHINQISDSGSRSFGLPISLMRKNPHLL